MSYILEALRRSQAERERGQVPGLGAQPITAPSAASKPRRVPGGLWALVAASVLVLLAAAVVLSALWTRRSVEVPAAAVAAAGPATVAAAAVTAPVAVAVPTAQQPLQPAQPAPVLSTPLPTVVSAPPVIPQTTAPQPAPTPTITAQPAAQGTSPLPTAATTVPATAAAPPADARPIPYAQLSADQRRELPALQVSGSIWSDNASSRFVMLNGMVIHEGEMVAPGLKLERIAQKSAVLRWRDLRFEIGL